MLNSKNKQNTCNIVILLLVGESTWSWVSALHSWCCNEIQYLLWTRLCGAAAGVLPARKSSSRPPVYCSDPGSLPRSASACWPPTAEEDTRHLALHVLARRRTLPATVRSKESAGSQGIGGSKDQRRQLRIVKTRRRLNILKFLKKGICNTVAMETANWCTSSLLGLYWVIIDQLGSKLSKGGWRALLFCSLHQCKEVKQILWRVRRRGNTLL